MKYTFSVYLLAGLYLVGCHSAPSADQKGDIAVTGDTVVLDANSPVVNKLQIAEASLHPFCSEFRTVGTVRAEAGHLAEIAAPYEGRVMRSMMRLGQRVTAGEALFEISSSEFLEASKAYFEARSNSELAARNYNRKKELLAGGIASQRDLEEAQTVAENARKELEQASAALEIFHVRPSELRMGQPLRVCSPISGEVVACDITVGQYVKSDAAPLATVADLNRVWVVALVKENYFGAIHRGDKVEVYTDAEPGRVVWGEIYHIGEMLDEQTRSVQVVVVCDNRERRLKPGMFTSVHFLNAPHDALLLPSSAIFQDPTDSYLYVAEGTNQYVRRPVEVESIKGDSVHIIHGLSAGERVVMEGGIFLTEQ